VEDGRQDVEKSLQEGNDFLNEANKLADEISLAVVVSVLSSLSENWYNEASVWKQTR